MKHLHVACAIIEENGRVLATQRSESMSLPLKWEFPGGKIRPAELPDDCLRRELLEELGVEVSVDRPLSPVTHNYESFMVTLHPFICAIAGGEITLYEHAACCWLLPEELPSLDWAEADWPLVKWYREQSLAHYRDMD